MNIIILGPQGSGKGTQAKLLADKFNLKHISSGQLLRQEAESGSPKGKLIAEIQSRGVLVPFETLTELLEPAIRSAANGFILDGTPRELSQAEYLDSFLKELGQRIDYVVYLHLTDEEAINRLKKRAEIENRSDDTPEGIRHRLDLFKKVTLPVIDYYRHQNLLIDIDGTPDIETIHLDILSKLQQKQQAQ